MKAIPFACWCVLAVFLLSACAPAATPAPTAALSAAPAPRLSDTPAPVLTPLPTATPLPNAYLSEASGEVASRPDESADFQPAHPPQPLLVGAQVRTGEQGRARLDLTSGTTLRLPPRTLFTLQENRPTETGLLTRVQLLLGEVFILLTGGGSVEVETDSGSAAVRGSYMLVSIPPEGGLLVQCLEGFCSLTTPFTFLELSGGQGVQVPFWSGQGTPPALQIFRLTEADVRRWRDENPEVERILPQLNATLTALPPLPLQTPALLPITPTLPGIVPTAPGGLPIRPPSGAPEPPIVFPRP
ncbi:MAG: FecR domain-containing protein [Chloroflexota bacterium]